MIYICVAAQNDARSIGLLLWKVRKVFHEFPREYHVLAADQGSTDETLEVLENYQGAVPMSIGQAETKGYAATLEELLRTALERSDRPKRDLAITLPADYRASPAIIPTLVRSFESGADVIVGETYEGEPRIGWRIVRRAAAWLLKPGLNIPGVRDLTSGVNGYRLVTLRNCMRGSDGPLLRSEGMSADAELLARAAANARQVAVVSGTQHWGEPGHTQGESLLGLAASLYRTGRLVRIPAPPVEVTRA